MGIFLTLRKITIVIFVAYTAMFAATAVHLYHMAEHGMHAGEHCVFVFDDISLCAKQAVRNLATPTILSEEQFFNLSITYGVLVAVIVLLLLQQRVSYVERYRLPPLLYNVLFSSGIFHPKAP